MDLKKLNQKLKSRSKKVKEKLKIYIRLYILNKENKPCMNVYPEKKKRYFHWFEYKVR